MTTIPPEAVEAVARAMHDDACTCGLTRNPDANHWKLWDDHALTALTAALPHIEAAWQARLTERAKALQTTEPSEFGDGWNAALRYLAETTARGTDQ